MAGVRPRTGAPDRARSSAAAKPSNARSIIASLAVSEMRPLSPGIVVMRVMHEARIGSLACIAPRRESACGTQEVAASENERGVRQVRHFHAQGFGAHRDR